MIEQNDEESRESAYARPRDCVCARAPLSYVYKCVPSCVSACVPIHVCICTCVCASVRVYVRACVRAYLRACVPACVRVCYSTSASARVRKNKDSKRKGFCFERRQKNGSLPETGAT